MTLTDNKCNKISKFEKKIPKIRYLYYNEYGRVVLTLNSALKKRNITPYRLSVLTGINWGIIKKYMKGSLYRVDLDLLARICYVLRCDLCEIIHYEEKCYKKHKNYPRKK